MKTVLVLAGLVALAAGTVLPYASHEVKTIKLDEKLIDLQYKVLELLENPTQEEQHAVYYKIGREYSIEANADKYSSEAVAAFLGFYKIGFLPKYQPFTIFNERQRDEAITLYDLFYTAKDFDTLYKTAAFVRVHMNSEQFAYAFYTAIVQRPDTNGIVLPAPYELYPQYFVNLDVVSRIFAVKMQDGLLLSEDYVKTKFGIYAKDNAYYFYANYSGPMVYPDDRNWLSYLTEDIGWNAYYYYFHTQMPFWAKGEQILGPFKERRGEIYYYFYQQLLARYYLERLTNGLGEIPTFSWRSPIEAGYYPSMFSSVAPFAQRSEKYYLNTPDNYRYIEFLRYWENNFLNYLQMGQCKAYKYEVDFSNSKTINFVGNYWQSNHDLYQKLPRNYERSYEVAARRVLSPAPKSFEDHEFWPSALDFYQTSLRDPAFYQLYSKIIGYIFQYKDYLEPYSQEILHYVGVKVNDVKVDKLYTFFEYYDFNATNIVFLTKEEQAVGSHSYVVRQPRLNHKPFSVTIDVKSDVEAEATFKVFMGPKYDGEGRPLTLEDNWMNFVELDWFTHKLTPGQNKIERHSQDFFFYKEDSVPIQRIMELLKQGQVPKDMSEDYDSLPQRLMLPRGTKGGFPVQFFVFVYPHQPLNKEYEHMQQYVLDNKPFGYPLDRPVPVPELFIQPNMYFEDVYIYQEGEESPRWVDGSYMWNHVPKH